MTAEIAVLNKSAVALAADSAVTISRGDSIEKTYNVNKLFTLSKYHPVGVMVFDSAQLMGVPWETIIKLYRRDLDRRHLPTVADYAADFIKYISESRTLFPVAKQRRAFSDATLVAYYTIRNKALDAIQERKKVRKSESLAIYEAEIKNTPPWQNVWRLF